MSRPLRWILVLHRGMYVHALAFMLPDDWLDATAPGLKWGYLVGVGAVQRANDGHAVHRRSGRCRLLPPRGGRASGSVLWQASY